MSYKNNRFKISAAILNEEFELPNGSRSLSYIQDYFEYIIKKHEKFTHNPPVKISVKKLENRIRSKIKIVYYFELLMPEKMKLLGRSNSKITKDKMVKMCLI